MYSHHCMCVCSKHFLNFRHHRMFHFHLVYSLSQPEIQPFFLVDLFGHSKARSGYWIWSLLLENPCFWTLSTKEQGNICVYEPMYVHCVGHTLLIGVLLARNAWGIHLGHSYCLWTAPTDISPDRANVVAGSAHVVLIIMIQRNILATTIQCVYLSTQII